MSLKSQIEDFLKKNPGSKQADLVRNFPGEDYNYISKVKSLWKSGKSKKPKKKGRKSKKGKKVNNKKNANINNKNVKKTPSNIPDDFKIRATYMQYFKDKGLRVTFNEIDNYLNKNNIGGSELAAQLSVNQLLAVIKPNESLLPANSPSMSSSKDSTSLTNSPKSKS